jgi:hypothetical protein
MGSISSSFTGGDKAPMMLRREFEVMEDTRRMRREAREPFFSSTGEDEVKFSSVREREERERRLPGREFGVACRPDPADEIDMLRSSRRLIASELVF